MREYMRGERQRKLKVKQATRKKLKDKTGLQKWMMVLLEQSVHHRSFSTSSFLSTGVVKLLNSTAIFKNREFRTLKVELQQDG